MKTTETKNFDYLGSNIAFQIGDGIMVNATQMAKPFGKKASHWLRNQQAKDFISKYISCEIATRLI